MDFNIPMESQTHKTILVVDDQSTMRTLIRQFLLAEGYKVVDVDNGEEAVKLASSTNYDGILLDFKMSGIDGVETCRQIRRSKRHQVTPILFITSMGDDEALQNAFEAGCDDFIVKPINPIVLHARLKAHIDKTELYYQLERVRKSLNRYISPRTQKVVEQYAGTGEYPPPEKREICSLFTDIRGFTQLSQHIPTERLFALLSEHLAYQVELVYQYGGYVDKYAGDGIMAIFEEGDIAERSCVCALEIIKHAKDLASHEQRHLFAVGCGIDKGQAIIGNIGSPEHLDYSVVGETVNLAARLCGYARPMSIAVSKSIYQKNKNNNKFLFSEEHDIEFKGFEKLVAVRELHLKQE